MGVDTYRGIVTLFGAVASVRAQMTVVGSAERAASVVRSRSAAAPPSAYHDRRRPRIAACQYDNQSSEPTPAGCSTPAADTSTGNIAFDNVLLGGAGPTSTVSSAALATSTNITSMMTGLFVNAAAGNYALAAGGPGVGTGVATFSGASAPAAGTNSYDIGAFSYAP